MYSCRPGVQPIFRASVGLRWRPVDRDVIAEQLQQDIPAGWFDAVEVTCDREEILVIGTLRPVADEPDEQCIARFREETRDRRMQIARRAEGRFERKVSWGARCGPTTALFTTVSTPAMTRLRLPERRVLDTLIDAGIARSRSDALAWCVRLVGANEKEWLAELREAFATVERARAKGPKGNLPT